VGCFGAAVEVETTANVFFGRVGETIDISLSVRRSAYLVGLGGGARKQRRLGGSAAAGQVFLVAEIRRKLKKQMSNMTRVGRMKSMNR
jgi:hypothetical protein